MEKRARKSGNANGRREGAAQTIRGFCEREFCETLKAVFLGEGNLALQDSLGLGAQLQNGYDGGGGGGGRGSNGSRSGSNNINGDSSGDSSGGSGGGSGSGIMLVSGQQRRSLVRSYLEVWDYVGGALFRGFIADRHGQSAMFVFFEDGVVGRDLKPGLMALLELCSLPETECSQLVVCLDRRCAASETRTLMRDLGWVGFEPMTLDDWTDGGETLSERWIFLGMET